MRLRKYSVKVSRAELARGLRLVTVGLRGEAAVKLRFSLVDGYLEIMGPGAAHSIPAEGRWPSAILADASVLKRVASRLPCSDPLVLAVENSRLYLGSFSLPATVLEIAPAGTQLPIGATKAEILFTIERLGEACVAGSIGRQAIEKANEELSAHVDQVGQALESYGVTRTEITRLVHRAIRENTTRKISKNGSSSTEKEGDRGTAQIGKLVLASAQGAADANLAVKIPHVEHLRKVSDCWSCPAHDAIREFAKERYSALTRKVVLRLQRIKASGIYGDDYRHKTLWDEYCHEVQEGPYDLLDDVWDKTLGPVLHAIVDAVPSHEAALLTIGAVWDLDEDYDSAPVVALNLILRNLREMISKMAGARDMSRFDPNIF